MPGIRDVAQRANVSVGTVSRELAKNETINPDLREVIETAIVAVAVAVAAVTVTGVMAAAPERQPAMLVVRESTGPVT